MSSQQPMVGDHSWGYRDSPDRIRSGKARRLRQTARNVRYPDGLPTGATRVKRSAERIPGLDAFRGLAILAVLFIHISGHFAALLNHESASVGGVTPEPSPGWYALAITEQALQFAVPSFLMLSAFLNAHNLLGGYTPRRFYRSRAGRVLWPYLVWSAIGMTVSYYAHVRRITPSNIVPLLLWGGGYYHLYFLVVLLQLVVLLPFLVIPFKRRPPFWIVAIGAVLLQAGFYLFNRYCHQSLTVGSVISWYVLPVALGLWLSSQATRLTQILRRGLPAAIVIAAASFAVFGPLAVGQMHGDPPNTLWYQVSEWGYTASASFILLAIARAIPVGLFARLLQFWGFYSLQIYLLHPFVLLALDRWWGPVSPSHVTLGVIEYTCICLTIPLLIARLARLIRVSRLVFGS